MTLRTNWRAKNGLVLPLAIAAVSGAMLAAIGLLASACLYWKQNRSQLLYEAYLRVEPLVLMSRADVAVGGGTLLVGDSISAYFNGKQLCGSDVFNAGISGARLKQVADITPTLIEKLHPRLVIIAVGTNDALKSSHGDVVSWGKSYNNLVHHLRINTVVLVEPPRIELGKSGSDHFDLVTLRLEQEQVRSLSRNTHVSVVESPSFQTTDGVHPSKLGSAQWRKAVEQVCSKV